MSSFRSLNFNNGQGINLGFITKYWGLSGYNPIETQRPTGFNINKLKKTIQDKYSSDVPSAISVINNATYQSFDDANTALDAVADTLLNNVYWLYGDLYTGGCFMWSSSGSDIVQFVIFHGLYRINDLIQGDSYNYYCSSLNVPFKVQIPWNNQPIVDNILYFFNANETEQDAPTNHVFKSELQLRIVDGRSLDCYRGSDRNSPLVPGTENWIQSQGEWPITSYAEFNSAYLYEYTDDDLTNITPHPWYRWFQNRVVPNLQFITGIEVENGELVGGYVPIEDSDAVTTPDSDPNGDSGSQQGGDGDKNGVGDDVGSGELPSSNFLNTGISRIYLPTESQMTAFARYVFSDITQSAVDQLKKMWSNPLDYVENLGVCRLTGLTPSGTANISFGGIDTNVSCNYVNNAFIEFDYARNIGEFWGNALDYSSYTKLKIFIPYCGLYDLNVDEFMINIDKYGGCDVTLRYRVDLMSGMCVAMIRPSRAQYGTNYGNLNSFLYQFNGNIYLPLSLTATDWRNTYQSVLGIAGGMIAPSPSTAVGMAENIMGQKVNVQHSGSIGTNFGYMGIQTPYLIIERPAISEPKLNKDYNYETNYGYPSNKLMTISNLRGFVKVRKGSFWGQNLHATDEERKEIISLLENEGVWMG